VTGRHASAATGGASVEVDETARSPSTTRRTRSRALGAALCGLVSAAFGLGIAELAAALIRPEASPVIAVGNAAIAASPQSVKDFAIRNFGTGDKPVLVAGIVVVLAVAAMIVGVIGLTHRTAAALAALALGVVGAVAALTGSSVHPLDAAPSLLAGISATAVLMMLLNRLDQIPAPADPVTGAIDRGNLDRRRVLVAGGLTAAAAVIAGVGGRFLERTHYQALASRSRIRLPKPASPVRPLPAGASLDVPGLSPFLTTNAAFYRVDTALVVPQVVADTWRLRIHGMVDNPMTLSFRDLAARKLIERDITLTCVSNEVGGPYVSTATFLGAPLADLLREAKVRPGAQQIASRSVDGWTSGTPTSVVLDGRDAMLAIGMNGVPLPVEHGFPVRMVVPGLYGYVSATKWLVDLELTTFGAFDPYWVQRGWSQQAPIKTESRIDTPQSGADLTRGRIPIAGIAWAQHRGIRKVEVRVDDGPWHEATLALEPSADTWRQWVWRWDATSGQHTLAVRATDDDGVTQTSAVADPVPNGATGWHTIQVSVQ
jgi:DMSO/TMAO reductase YedYZ molybdopterin-dependent catalytic subunit